MIVQLILCHPNSQSFNHAIAEQVKTSLLANSHVVRFHDLYQEGFDPVLTNAEIMHECSNELVTQHIHELTTCNGIVIIHPNWWGKPPAMMSGWIDRVLRMNMAYTFPKGGDGGAPIGLLKIRKALILNTSNTTSQREEEIFGDPLERIWRNCVFEFCGVNDVVRRTFSVVVDASEEQRKVWLAEVARITNDYFPPGDWQC